MNDTQQLPKRQPRLERPYSLHSNSMKIVKNREKGMDTLVLWSNSIDYIFAPLTVVPILVAFWEIAVTVIQLR